MKIVIAILLAATPAAVLAQSGYYTLNGGSASLTNQSFPSTLTNQSSIYVTNAGALTLISPTTTKTGDTTNATTSSQYGLNAGILANSAGKVSISGGSV